MFEFMTIGIPILVCIILLIGVIIMIIYDYQERKEYKNNLLEIDKISEFENEVLHCLERTKQK